MKFSLFPLLLFILAVPVMATDVTITTKSLPNGTVDKAYSGAIKADDGCAPYTWAISSGSLPAGVTKTRSSNTTSLDLNGTPSAADKYSFTVLVKDCKEHVDKKSYTVTIQKAAEHVVDLRWESSTSTEIAGYNVYRSPNGSKWSRINAELVGPTSYDDSTVANDSTYYYAVTAVGSDGKESSKTPSVKVVIP
jgi:hypothetical protein